MPLLLLDTDVEDNSEAARAHHRRALRRRPRAPAPPGARARHRRRRARSRALGIAPGGLPHERGPRRVPRARAAADAVEAGRALRRGARGDPRLDGLHHAHAGAGRQRALRPRAGAPLPRAARRRGRALVGRVRRPRQRAAATTASASTPLALRTAARANGVSAAPRRGRARDVARALAGRAGRCRSAHVTNGVHFAHLDRRRACGSSLADAAGRRARDGADPGRAAVGRARRPRRERASLERARDAQQRGSSSGSTRRPALDPDALTIGFARRFATYKRAALLLSDAERAAAAARRSRAAGAARRRRQGAPCGRRRQGADPTHRRVRAGPALTQAASSSCETTTWRWRR